MDIYNKCFFCDEGLVVLKKEYSPKNPLYFKKNNELKFKIFPMKNFITEALDLEDNFYHLSEGIFDLKNILKNSSTIAYGIKDYDIFEINSIERAKSLDVDFLIFCDEDCNIKNFNQKELDDFAFCDTEDFICNLAWDLVDYIYDEIYFVQVYDINDISNIKISKYFEYISKNKIITNNMFKNIYINKISDIFNYRINISVFKDEEKLNLYSFIFNELEFKDFDDIIEVDGELYSKDNFVSEYIQNINKKPQKEHFFKVLYYAMATEAIKK